MHKFRELSFCVADHGPTHGSSTIRSDVFELTADVEGGLMRAIVQDVPTLDDALHVTESVLLEDTATVAAAEA